jgi:hypothetical protein
MYFKRTKQTKHGRAHSEDGDDDDNHLLILLELLTEINRILIL